MAKRKQQLIHKPLKHKTKYSKRTGKAAVDWDDEDACEQLFMLRSLSDCVASP